MKHTYDRLLSDDELRPHLERGDAVAFQGLGGEWEEIEQQVERLGFGDAYAVCRTKRVGGPGEEKSVKVVPFRAQTSG